MKSQFVEWTGWKKKLALLLGLPLIVGLMYACGSEEGIILPHSGPEIEAAALDVTFEADGAGQLLFLEPLADGSPTEPLTTGLADQLQIEICELATDGTVIEPCLLEAVEELDGQYGSGWKSDRQEVGSTYSLAVQLNGLTIGEIVITLTDGGFENAGSNFPIRFWLGGDFSAFESGTLCVDDPRCDSKVVDDSEETVVEALDENGKVVAQLTIPSGAAGQDLLVTLDCRIGSETEFMPGEGPLPTSLDQWPLFCHVDATTLDGQEFTSELNSNATIEICKPEADGDPYHGPNASDLRVAKFNQTEGLTLLDPSASDLSCEGVTAFPTNTTGSLLEWLDQGVGTLLRPLMPAELHAWMFSDGGVGALLISFSDINQVDPASIRGSVGGTATVSSVEGLDVTLSGGFLDAPVTVQTGADGTFDFMTDLLAGASGTDYTVTLDESSLGSGVHVVENPITLTVDGSGEFTADFELVDVLFGGATLDGGSGAVWDWAVGSTTGTDTAPFATNQYPSCGTLDPIITTDVGTEGVWPLGSNASPSVITLTKDFFVPAGTTGLTLTGWVDNDAKVLLNGNDITASAGVQLDGDGFAIHEGCANLNPLAFTPGADDFTDGAVNTFVISVKDRGVVGYADFELSVPSIIQ